MGVKKRSPTKTIEATPHPEKEHTLIKPYKKEVIDITGYKSASNINARTEFRKFTEATSNGPYIHIHTHPSEAPHLNFWDKLDLYFQGVGKKEIEKWKNITALPSGADMGQLIITDDERTMDIAVRNPKTGEVLGYNVLRKTKKTPKWGTARAYIQKHFFKGVMNLINYNLLGLGKRSEELSKDKIKYHKEVLKAVKSGNYQRANEALEIFADKYSLQHRMVPAQNYKVMETKGTFVNKGLEQTVSVFIGIGGLLISLLFLSSNFTGFAIANLTQRTSNIIGMILFIVSLIVLFFIMKRRKN
ncbi:MAG: hypothetical protein PHH54_05220 [Candidatus Nanoarchaeia archaeon]|nr:hypothetical protein [Candidatus Nanoarchaeia archaeon]MDD5741358.1 hypothetical protein [Candidatus Nanoarchaeia archaeon]